MAQSVEDVIPRIRSLAKRYKGPCCAEDDLFSVGMLAVVEAEPGYRGEGDWVAFAVCVAMNRMRDEVRRSVKYDASRVLYDALSTTATLCMLRRHAIGGATSGVQDEDAYVSEIMGRIKTDALGKTLFAESLHGKVSILARARKSRRRIAVRTERRAMAEALKKAVESAALLVEDT